eukprot:TRINITY_DN3493_c6_g1_i1.p1 TRINITY_DN3493_c6_g1~~TRINITY_DN3493_c6_g1_i1.p1  ORF type:complete len:147 (-),score=9.65 TRINITY_DN3493_c6_g1_i1:146-586(-)
MLFFYLFFFFFLCVSGEKRRKRKKNFLFFCKEKNYKNMEEEKKRRRRRHCTPYVPPYNYCKICKKKNRILTILPMQVFTAWIGSPKRLNTWKKEKSDILINRSQSCRTLEGEKELKEDKLSPDSCYQKRKRKEKNTALDLMKFFLG